MYLFGQHDQGKALELTAALLNAQDFIALENLNRTC
jgi:hypothetical protein